MKSGIKINIFSHELIKKSIINTWFTKHSSQKEFKKIRLRNYPFQQKISAKWKNKTQWDFRVKTQLKI